MTKWNYCPKCGTELVDRAEFCHSCGRSLSELEDTTENSKGSDEGSSNGVFSYLDDVTMDSIDFDPYSPSSSGETRKQMEEEIGKVVEETGLTIDDIGADEIFMYFIVDKIFERSAEIKLEEANRKSPDIHSVQDEIESS